MLKFTKAMTFYIRIILRKHNNYLPIFGYINQNDN